MSLWRRPLGFLDGLLDRVAAVIGAVALSQFPQFFGQYLQRLGGHLDEARQVLERYERAAESLGLSLEEYIREHLEAESDVFRTSGETMQEIWQRAQDLEQSYLALQEANIFNRWFVFFQEVEWSIAAGTWQDFTPGVPTTVEGLVYAFVGLLAGWGVYTLLKAAVSRPARALARRRQGPNQSPPGADQ